MAPHLAPQPGVAPPPPPAENQAPVGSRANAELVTLVTKAERLAALRCLGLPAEPLMRKCWGGVVVRVVESVEAGAAVSLSYGCDVLLEADHKTLPRLE